MIVDEDIYLEHYGKKGMQWGVRNKSNKPKPTAKEKRAKSKKRKETVNKVASGVITAVMVAGYVSSILAATGGTKTSNIRPPKPARAKSVTDLINDRRKTEVSSLLRMHREGKMDSEQLSNFSRILNARYDRKVADAIKNAGNV